MHEPTHRTATPQDVVARLTDTHGLYEWTAVTALGWGMGPAQLHIDEAVTAAEQAGLVRTTLLRGKRMVQLAPRTDRIRVLRESIARRALNTIGTPADAEVLAIVRTGDVLHVATTQPDEHLPYAVDSFRFPTPDLDDPDYLDEADAPKRWTLVYQHGGAGPDEIGRMLAGATAYAAELTAVAA
ncbi:hypothetical protein ACFVOO_16165 [Streptomyces rochei]|uniref:hypothetical protein n=1 Tax=Streptomyces rochei TaxID=1928 RepID=UPI0036A065EF